MEIATVRRVRRSNKGSKLYWVLAILFFVIVGGFLLINHEPLEDKIFRDEVWIKEVDPVGSLKRKGEHVIDVQYPVYYNAGTGKPERYRSPGDKPYEDMYGHSFRISDGEEYAEFKDNENEVVELWVHQYAGFLGTDCYEFSFKKPKGGDES